MQDSLQDTPTSHDSPPSPCEGVSPTMDTSTNDTDDDTHKEEEEYAEVIENFLHLPQGDVEDNPIQRLAQTKLYDISDVSTLSTLLLLLNLQAKYGWSDTSVSALFKWVISWNLWTKVSSSLLKMPSNSLVAWLSFVCRLLKDKMLPFGNALFGSHRDAKKHLTIFGLSCEFIHSYKNNYVLFRGEAEKLMHCPKCGEPWYKQDFQGASIPQKVNINYPSIKAWNLMLI